MINSKRITLSNLIYLLLAIWLCLSIISTTTIPRGYPVFSDNIGKIVIGIRLLLIAIYIIEILINRVKAYEIFSIVIFMILVILSWKTVGTWMLFDLFFIPLYLNKNLDYKRICDLFFYVFVVATITIFILNCLELLPQITFSRANDKIRYNMGFSHPNALGFMVINICVLYVLRKENLKWKDYLLLVILGLFVMIFPNSETASAIIFLLTLLCFIFRKKENKLASKHKKRKIFILSVIFMILVIAGVYLITLKGLGGDIIYRLSGTFYTRFRYGYDAIVRYGFSLFGQEIHTVGDVDIINGTDIFNYFSLDCAYFYLPIARGIIPTAVYLFVYVISIKNTIEKNNFKMLIVLLLLLLYGISETNIMSFYVSYIFIYTLEKSKLNII